MSAMIRPNRSSSRLSMSSKLGGGSRASDEDSKTAVKVGMCAPKSPPRPNKRTCSANHSLVQLSACALRSRLASPAMN